MAPTGQDRALSLARIISSAVPTAASIEKIHAIPSTRRRRQYEAQLSDESHLVLCLPPPLMVKLLRSEKASSVSAEAAVLDWIGHLNTDDHDQNHEQHAGPLPDPGGGSDDEPPEVGDLQQPPGRSQLLGTEGRTKTGRSRAASQFAVSRSDISFIPVLIAHSPADTLAGPEFNVVRPTRGSLIASLSPPLTHSERRAVDFQNGRLLRQLSRMRSPSGKFGPALGVLGYRLPSSPHQGVGVSGATGQGPLKPWEPRSSSTWSAAFAGLLEGVLRDGEDMHVTLPYSTIRQHFWRLEHHLGAITNACLVVVDAAEDDNVLVARKGEPEMTRSNSDGYPPWPDGMGSHGMEMEKRKQKTKNNIDREREGKGATRDEKATEELGPDTPDLEETGEETPSSRVLYPGTDIEEGIVVTGVRDWSNCVFGDPLFATAFYQSAKDDLWSGFTGSADEKLGPNPIEGEGDVEARMILYECYHTITQVVKEFYRPSKDSGKREMAARKALTNVLARLDRVPDGIMRRRRPSGEMSPAKRYKTDDDEDDNGDA